MKTMPDCSARATASRPTLSMSMSFLSLLLPQNFQRLGTDNRLRLVRLPKGLAAPPNSSPRFNPISSIPAPLKTCTKGLCPRS